MLLKHVIILTTINTIIQSIHTEKVTKKDIQNWLNEYNEELRKQNALGAEIAWEASVNPGNPELQDKSWEYQKNRIKWQHSACDKLVTPQYTLLFNHTQRRQMAMLCRGPRFTFDETRRASALYEELQSIYSNARICIPTKEYVSTDDPTKVEAVILNFLQTVEDFLKSKSMNVSDHMLYAAKIVTKVQVGENNALCFAGETDFEKMMSHSRNERVLRFIWSAWRERVGPPMRAPYKKFVLVQNVAARRNKHSNIGDVWQDELEMSSIKKTSHDLYQEIRPLYKMLHGVVRYFLRKKYGEIIPINGPIPAHMLGSLWSSNWEHLLYLIVPNNIDLDKSIRRTNWNVLQMVKHAEDYYVSLGLPPMTESFWQNSVFTKGNGTRCHGTAADMFKTDDYRLLYCADTTMNNFYVLHHEMGHIEYYMAYKDQPATFRQGTNSAFQESIGDAIMYGVLAPQHLHRIGLINDSLLYNDYLNDDSDSIEFTHNDIFLLKHALNKLPQIPFSLLLDEYRWSLFEGYIENDDLNKHFWDMAFQLQGIAPLSDRNERHFDAGAIFYVADNTPTIRYFFSSFLQLQLFETLCKTTMFGRNIDNSLPDSVLLNRCDLYGCKVAGKLLMDIMSKGKSVHWQDLLSSTTGFDQISTSSLEKFYQPLSKMLKKLIKKYDIPLGWLEEEFFTYFR